MATKKKPFPHGYYSYKNQKRPKITKTMARERFRKNLAGRLWNEGVYPGNATKAKMLKAVSQTANPFYSYTVIHSLTLEDMKKMMIKKGKKR